MRRPDHRVADLVQAGQIRVALFLPQYTNDAATGELYGVGTGFLAIEIARVLATRLGIQVLIVEHPTPPRALESLKTGACDVAFLGIEASRSEQVDFSPPVVQFDYTYLVPAGSLIQSAADADQPGFRIAVVTGHASALALNRIVKHAELVGSELPDVAFNLFRAGNASAFAFPREPLLDYSIKLPGSRVLSDSYGVNRVAMAVPKGQTGWLAYIREFIEEAKASGLIHSAIERGGLRGFCVASSENPN